VSASSGAAASWRRPAVRVGASCGIGKGLVVGGLALRAMAAGALAVGSVAVGEAKKSRSGPSR
jgi:hypothetical protein